MTRRYATALLVAILVLASVRPAVADTAGSVDITVLDITTGRPITLARVVFYDCASVTGYTDEQGIARFDSIPAGSCRVQVTKRGYKGTVSPAFVVDPVRLTTATVRLAGNALKTIGRVTVTSSTRLSPTDLDASSPQALLHTSLGDALGDLADVLSTDSGLAIDGRDAAQTGASVDGVPVASGPSGVNADLFGGASVLTSPTNGNLGGNVGFYSIVPTIAFESDLQLAYGSNNSSSLRFAERGSAGNVGLVYAHASRGVNSPLNDLTFMDASGLAYQHAAGNATNGDYLRVRVPFALGHALSATFFTNNGFADATCARISGPLPCGYGPGNATATRGSTAVLAYNNHFGAFNFQMNGFSSSSYYDSDFSHRILNGFASPSSASAQSRITGLNFFGEAPIGERHDLTFSAQQFSTRTSSTQFNSVYPGGVSGTTTSTFTTFGFNDSFHADSRTTISAGFGTQRSAGIPAQTTANAGVVWHANTNDTLRGSYSAGSVGANFYGPQFFSDPQSLVYNCDAKTVIGGGPGDTQGPQDTISANLSFEHRLPRGRAFASAYREVQHGALAQTIVDAGDFGTPFPPLYLSQIANFARTPAACGFAGNFLTFPTDLYLRTPVSGLNRTYEGGTAGLVLAVGRGLQIAPFFALERATLGATNDPRIANPFSIYVPGRQLPNVPFSRWGFIGDYKPPRGIWEALLDVQHVSTNNPSNLPAYTTVAAGIALNTPAGSLTFVGSNLTNQLAGNFASPANAVPLPTNGGTGFPTIAQPLAPRSFAVLFTSRIGRFGAGNHGAETTELGSTGGRGVSFSFRPTPFPKTAPATPFAIQTANASCTADVARALAPDFAALTTFVGDLEKHKVNGVYPATATVPRMTLLMGQYFRVGTSYTVELWPRGTLAVVALLTCGEIHMGQQSELRSFHLYEPKVEPNQPLPVLFSPRVGLYGYIAPQAMVNIGALKPLPKTRPTNPFAIAASCPAADAPVSRLLIRDVRAYLAANPKPQITQTYDWGAIVPHATKHAWYLELALDDPFATNSLARCVTIFQAKADELAAADSGGAPFPAINYDPRFGLYVYYQAVTKITERQ